MRALERGTTNRGIVFPLFLILLACRPPGSQACHGCRPGLAGPRSLASQCQLGSRALLVDRLPRGPTPVYGSRIRRNEHTVWASRDPHANAFQTLYSDASRSIAKKLGQNASRTIPARTWTAAALPAIPHWGRP